MTSKVAEPRQRVKRWLFQINWYYQGWTAEQFYSKH